MRNIKLKTVSLLVVCAAAVFWATTVRNQTSDGEIEPVKNQASNPVGIDHATGLGLAEMARQSRLIAIGRCTGTESKWIDRVLVTLARIEVTEVIKGEAVTEVTVVLPGGADLNRKIPVAMTYPGAPQILPNENVFLFLTDEESLADGLSVTGYSQGKFSISTDAQGQQVVSRDLTKLRLQGGGGAVRGSVTLTPLAEFKQEVIASLQQ